MTPPISGNAALDPAPAIGEPALSSGVSFDPLPRIGQRWTAWAGSLGLAEPGAARRWRIRACQRLGADQMTVLAPETEGSR